MKKIICFILAVLLLCSCAKPNDYIVSPEFYSSEFLVDYDQNRNLLPIFDGVCKSENAFYICSHNRKMTLEYYDIASGTAAPLCAKPECDHTGDDCNASLSSSYAQGLSVYDKKLYWTALDFEHGFSIFSASLDGTDRQAVRTLPESFAELDAYTIFHRGYVYLADSIGSISNGSTVTSVKVCAALIDGDEEFVIIDNKYKNGTNAYVSIQATANTLYIAITTNDLSENHLELYSWDSVTRKLKLLYDDSVAIAVIGFWVDPNEGIYLSDSDLNIYKYDNNTGKISHLFNFGNIGDMTNKTRFAGFTEKYIIADVLNSDKTISICAKDYNGTAIYEKNLGEIGRNSGRSYFGCDRNNLIYRFLDIESSKMIYASVPLEEGEAKILWEFDM